MNKEKHKIKHKRKSKGELTWASDPSFGPPGDTIRAACSCSRASAPSLAGGAHRSASHRVCVSILRVSLTGVGHSSDAWARPHPNRSGRQLGPPC
jgi:hypothetical protein